MFRQSQVDFGILSVLKKDVDTMWAKLKAWMWTELVSCNFSHYEGTVGHIPDIQITEKKFKNMFGSSWSLLAYATYFLSDKAIIVLFTGHEHRLLFNKS